MRSLRGDLRHDPAVPGCSFVIEFAIAGAPEKKNGGRTEHNVTDQAAIS
jgi:hypothetical protein